MGAGAGDGADGQAIGKADHGAGVLLAAGGLGDGLLEVVEELAGGDYAVVVGVGLALKALKEEVGKDAVAVAPLGVFEGGFADIAGGDDGTLAFGGVALQVLVDEVVGVALAGAGAGSAEAVAVAGVGKGDDALGFEDALEDVLKLPHGEGGAAHVVGLGVGGQEIDIAGVERVGRAVPGDVNDDGVLLLGLGEEGEQGVADGLGGGVAIEEKQRVLVGDAAASRRLEEVEDGLGVAVGELEVVDLLVAALGVMGHPDDDGEEAAGALLDGFSGRDGLEATAAGRAGGTREVEQEVVILLAAELILVFQFDGVAPGQHGKATGAGQVDVEDKAVEAVGALHGDVGGFGIHLGVDGAVVDPRAAGGDAQHQLLDGARRPVEDDGAVDLDALAGLGQFEPRIAGPGRLASAPSQRQQCRPSHGHQHTANNCHLAPRLQKKPGLAVAITLTPPAEEFILLPSPRACTIQFSFKGVCNADLFQAFTCVLHFGALERCCHLPTETQRCRGCPKANLQPGKGPRLLRRRQEEDGGDRTAARDQGRDPGCVG